MENSEIKMKKGERSARRKRSEKSDFAVGFAAGLWVFGCAAAALLIAFFL